jgi:hypothetical protein
MKTSKKIDHFRLETLLAIVYWLMTPHIGSAAVTTVVNFDTAGNWTAGSASITSYASNHQYVESNLTFTGGPALRQTAGAQDGFPGAFGIYAWRFGNDSTSSWTATYTAALAPSESFGGFAFSARRWDGTPSPSFLVEYTVDGGQNWSTASAIGSNGLLNNAAYGDSSNWSNFSQSIISPVGLSANQFSVRISATGTTERMMVDDFSLTVIPEPSTYAVVLAMVAGGFLLLRRSARSRSVA